jgi:two-component system, LuxR family, sensor kinase FixL
VRKLPQTVLSPTFPQANLAARPIAGRTRLSILSLLASLGMSQLDFAHRYREMQRYVGWTDGDARRIAGLWPLVEPHVRDLIDDFYAEIQRHPDALRVITGGEEQIERLAATLRQWLAQLLAGQYDEEYMARRWKVGYRHVEIGLSQRFTSLALSRLRNGIMRCVCANWRGPVEELASSLGSLNKLLDLDHALIQDAYEFEHIRRERQSERERSDRKFRHLVENANSLIAILDATPRAVYFNPYAEMATGYAAAEMRSQTESLLSLFGDSDSEARSRLASALADQLPASYEVEISGRSSKPRWINWTLSRIDDLDESPAVLAVGHDVTERRQAVTQLLQASRLATIGEMYARLTHESRNALQRLRVCSELLADRLDADAEGMSLLKRSEQAQDDLRRLLDEVRNFASPIVLEKTECRMPTLWREAWNLLQATRADRRVELIEDLIGENCRNVKVDRFRMVQMFRNIFENSLAACQDPVAVRVGYREISPDGQLAVEVQLLDNGPGFNETTIDQVFEPFFTTRTLGTGLGLSIVRRIIEAHGGTVYAVNNPSGGANITFVLPCTGDG